MDKPFKTIEQQMAILKSRNMAVEPSAGPILLREGYYSVVNGYKGPFLEKGGEMAATLRTGILDGTSFDDVYRLFRFDRDLRLTGHANAILRRGRGDAEDGVRHTGSPRSTKANRSHISFHPTTARTHPIADGSSS